ncbi:MAG: 4-hydroxybenzoate octaprenyltransferase [Bosea sp. (in: a-proteobacteria)]
MSSPAPFHEPVPDALPDASRSGHWIDRRVPASLRPCLRLARIDRPIGWWLLLLPCWWSTGLAAIALAEKGAVPWLTLIWHAILLLIGAVVMRGAGSTFNDIIDRDLDAKVARTRHRPLPSGQISPKAAALFMVVQALLGFVVLIQFNWFTIWLGLASLVIVAIYPFMKRVTNLPQLVLGLAFSWGALVGWSAVFGSLGAPALLAYLAAILWTIGYDTIYALQDIVDDETAGIKSSARLFGSQTGLAISLLYAGAALSIALAAFTAGGGWIALVAVIAFGLHLAWQARQANGAKPELALKLFRSNRDAGLMLSAGFALDAVVKVLL